MEHGSSSVKPQQGAELSKEETRKIKIPNEVPANEPFEHVRDESTELEEHRSSSGEPQQGGELSEEERQQFEIPNEVPANKPSQTVEDESTELEEHVNSSDESGEHGFSSGEAQQGAELSKEETRKIKKLFRASRKNLNIGGYSNSSSLYIIVNAKELDEAEDEEKKKREEMLKSESFKSVEEVEKAREEDTMREMFKSVKCCGSVYSLNLAERIKEYRDGNQSKEKSKEERKNGTNQKNEKTNRQIKKEKREEESIIENMADCKMLEVVTYTKDSDTKDTRGYPYEIYPVILEFAVHSLRGDFPNLLSHPGFGSSEACVNWYCIDVFKKHLDILNEVKQKVIEALEKKKYVNEQCFCGRCGKDLADRSSVITHQTEGSCRMDHNYRIALNDVLFQKLDKTVRVFSVEEFQCIFNRYQELCTMKPNKKIKNKEVFSYDRQKFIENVQNSIILLLGSVGQEKNKRIKHGRKFLPSYEIEIDGEKYDSEELKELLEDRDITITHTIDVQNGSYDLLTQLKFEWKKSNTTSNDQF